MATVNRKSVVQEFFAWWGIYIVFLITLLLILSVTGITKISLTRDILLGVDYAALGALMAVSHYYLLYLPFFKEKKYPLYLILLVILIAVFMVLDVVLVWIQTWGNMSFSDPLNRMFGVHFRHVMMAYIPMTVIHTVSHIYMAKKEGKNS